MTRIAEEARVLNALVIGVVGMNVFAALLVLGRGPVWRTRIYRPMLVNIGLSVAPLIVLLIGTAAAFVLLAGTGNRTIPLLIGLATAAVWLLVLPNSSYLITELNFSHRDRKDPVPLWFDIILVLTLAMSGVLNTVINVLLVQFLYSLYRYGDTTAGLERADVRVLVAAVLLVVPFGIYLGRYIRLNSWDVRRPLRIYRRIREHFDHPGRVREAVAFTVLHALFLGLMYVALVGGLIHGLVLLEARGG